MLRGKIIVSNPPILNSIEINIVNPETMKGLKYTIRKGDIRPKRPPKFIEGKRYLVVVKRLKWKKSKYLVAEPGNCVSIRMLLTSIKVCVEGG